MTPENKVRNAVIKWAKAMGLRHKRMHFGRGVKTGFPDDMFLISRRICSARIAWTIFIEFKAPGRRPSEAQLQVLRSLQADGFSAFWTDSPETAIKCLSAHMATSAIHVASR